MKILVIGGTRFFGIHMVNKLLELGHSVLEIEFLELYLKEQIKLA